MWKREASSAHTLRIDFTGEQETSIVYSYFTGIFNEGEGISDISLDLNVIIILIFLLSETH